MCCGRRFTELAAILRSLSHTYTHTYTQFGSRSSGCAAGPKGAGSSGGKGSSVYLPVVVRSSTQGRAHREAMECAQDACTVDLHVPSRTIPDGESEGCGKGWHLTLAGTSLWLEH